jgi:hypothetical protein
MWGRLTQWLAGPALLILACAAWIKAQAGNYHWAPQALGILAVGAVWLQAMATSPRPGSGLPGEGPQA